MRMSHDSGAVGMTITHVRRSLAPLWTSADSRGRDDGPPRSPRPLLRGGDRGGRLVLWCCGAVVLVSPVDYSRMAEGSMEATRPMVLPVARKSPMELVPS
jgi:hypothetical protein